MMFLLYYTATNASGYKLVYAKTEQEAIDILKGKLFYLSNVLITNETI